MGEAATDRKAVEQALIRRSLQDESFRQRLLADPKATIEQELGKQLPADLKVQVLEETQDTVYLVLPPSRAPGELSDLELDAVAGAGATGVTGPIGTGRNAVPYDPNDFTGMTGPTGPR
jgi:hypothetical protein